MKTNAIGLLALLFAIITIAEPKTFLKRSIDLIGAHSLIMDSRLPQEITPNSYALELHPYPEEGYFRGRMRINVTWQESTDKITLHSHSNIQITHTEVTVTQYAPDEDSDTSSPELPAELLIVDLDILPKKSMIVFHLEKTLRRGTQCEVDLTFTGKLFNDTSEALFRNYYIDTKTGQQKWFVASQMRPNFARKVFPCFDEPSFKVPFTVSVIRHKSMIALSNMPLYRTEELASNSEWVRDHFQESPPMSTFTFSILIADLQPVIYNRVSDRDALASEIRVWARPDFASAVQNATNKIHKSLTFLEQFWDLPYPLPKIDCVALPNYQATRPSDSWGLLLFKESELSNRGSWQITHELVYQWLGDLATPYWWSDSHINNALAKYVATYTTLKISDGKETFHNWPMTMLYSIYYEFSKRYPHGKVMAIKQDAASTKTELVFRMLNYTLSEATLTASLQKFITDRQYKTFFAEDIWNIITEQARRDGTLSKDINVGDIAASWITKDRLPVLNVTRNYEKNTVDIVQHVYLRERPHDVPDQEKFLWWIPVVLVRGDTMNFTNSTPVLWMRRERQVKIENMPDSKTFIVVNPEEIGPFPVNYDAQNWNLLAQALLSDQRERIPVNTRAKLLHDAWNLAYAGDLNFGIALNMTLFLKNEREYLAWDPVFTMIDHIGRHIDSSTVFKKFQSYVRMLLTPLYEELGTQPKDGESEGTANLRNSAKIFLCQAGYKVCIAEAQDAFDNWMNAENPDEGNPVENQYICPVFKWGSKEEWEFGLQRIINFPPIRKQNERTYLLKTLAGCPLDSQRIEKLLNITILEQNGNFTDNDIYLIFSMLTGSATGYTTLFKYLDNNFETIRKAFENKPQLWSTIITSATSVFKTQEGLDMVKALHEKRKGDFGAAEFLVEKAIKNIKEEAKWSNDNLPVIEKWLDGYLKVNVSVDEWNKFFHM